MDASIVSLFLCHPLTGVRETNTQGDPDFESKDFVLWVPDGSEVNPATFDKDRPLDLKATVKFNGFEDYSNMKLQLRATFKDTYHRYPKNLDVYGNADFVVPESGGSFEKDITITIAHQAEEFKDLSCPWGLCGFLEFEIPLGDANLAVGKAEIELYGILGDLLQQYSEDGIPRDLLRVWVMPTIMHGILDEEKWIGWTIDRIHYPQTETHEKIDDLSDKYIHTLRYDIYRLVAHYSDVQATYFMLDDWLEDRKRINPYFVMNCYDCAGLVVASISLGVHYSRLRRQRLTHFGFLPSEGTSLIGWGITNTTYDFGHVTAKYRVLKDHSKRKPFANHTFASVDNANGEAMVLDACAGPVRATMGLKTYIDKCIDHSDNLKLVDRTYSSDKRYREANMDDYMTNDQDNSRGVDKSDKSLGLRVRRGWGLDLSTHANRNDKWLDEIQSAPVKKVVEQVSAYQELYTGSKTDLNLKHIFELLVVEMGNKCKVDKPPTLRTKHTSYGLSVICKFIGITATIVLCNSNGDAVNAYHAAISSSSNAEEAFAAPSCDSMKGCCHTVAKVANAAELWVHNNLLISVKNVDPSDERLTVGYVADWITNQIVAESPHKPTPLGDITVPEIEISPPIHKVVTIPVKAPGATDVFVESRFGVVSFRGCFKKGDYQWEVSFVAGEAKEDSVFIVSVGDDLSTKVVTVKVKFQEE